MSTKDDIREFLIAKRASISPEQAGLPAGLSERRVPGLRREEVAMLAGVTSPLRTPCALMSAPAGAVAGYGT